MATLNPNACYQASQVTTASRGTLLVLVYDGLLRFLAEGKRAMEAKQYEQQSLNLTKAQAIIIELMSSIDPSANPQLAAALEKLYVYLYDRLVWANVHDDEVALAEVTRILSELRETWAEADRKTRCQDAAPQQSSGFSAGGNAA